MVLAGGAHLVLSADSYVASTNAATATPWIVTRSVDPVTDVESVTVSGAAPTITVRRNQHVPRLSIRRRGETTEILYTIGGDGANFPRKGATVTLRLDTDPAESSEWTASTTRATLFYHGDVAALVDRLRAADRLLVRVQTTLGDITTATFDLAGLRASWDEFQR
jgi:hypothetical protein